MVSTASPVLYGFNGFYAVSMVSILRLRFPWFPLTLHMFSVVLVVSMVSIGHWLRVLALYGFHGFLGFYSVSVVAIIPHPLLFFNGLPLLPTLSFVHKHHRLP